MKTAIVTGSGGLVGSEAARLFGSRGFRVVGIDNDMRSYFFGEAASTKMTQRALEKEIPGFETHDVDIRDNARLRAIFEKLGSDIEVVIHAAAQPSHDWAAREPHTDFEVNAVGTLNLLELTRAVQPRAPFLFTSTNKVYGDTPNRLPLRELDTRWEIAPGHAYEPGIDETMSVDRSKHSLFGASKLAADVLVQEYGRYFDMKTACFRAGCISGGSHAGAELHGFLSYLMKCTMAGRGYSIFGYKGKQVRDNIHGHDLAMAFHHFYCNPRSGEVYNMGGGRESNCSILEAIALCEEIAGRKLKVTYHDTHRMGDHIWWISDTSRFRTHYPGWKLTHDVRSILEEIHQRLLA